MIKIILLSVIGVIIYLALGAIATIEHFERMGLYGGWLVLFWPVVYLGIAIALFIVMAEEKLEGVLKLARKIMIKWGKK